jgi:transcriptional regulator with XRE-family HTH domain
VSSLSDVAAAAIRAERRRRGWTQEQLAQRLAVDARTVGYLEELDPMKRRQQLTLEDLLAICQAFKVPLSRLLADADPGDLAALGLGSPG